VDLRGTYVFAFLVGGEMAADAVGDGGFVGPL
jgi:hypothetical protein